MAGCLWTLGLFWPLLFTLAQASNSTSPSPGTQISDVSYWVSFAKRITPGEPLAVHVYLANLSQAVELRLNLVDDQNNDMQEGQSFTLLGSGDIQRIMFQISNNLTRPEDFSYSSRMYVRVRASGGLQFDQYEVVTWKDLPLNIVVMMSQREYQPGQTVKFIAFVTSGLQVVKTPMDIEIKRHFTLENQTTVVEWKQVRSADKSGLYIGEYPTSPQADLGMYPIHVYAKGARPRGEWYVLKDYGEFQVKVDAPFYVTILFEQIRLNISARNATGSPVQGACSLVASLEGWGNTYQVVKNFSLDTAGKGMVTFTRAELTKNGSDDFFTSYHRFTFEATVTSDVTGNNVTSTATTTLSDEGDASELGVNVGLARNFKPGLSVSDYAIVTDYRYDLFRFYPNASIRLNVSYSDWEENWRELIQKDVKTGIYGFCFYTIDSVPANATGLKIQATRGNSSDSIELPPFKSPSRTYIQLELSTTRVKVQSSISLKVRSNTAFHRFTVQMYAKEALVMTKYERRSTLRKVHTFSFVMTSEMAPVVDVIAFITTDNGEIVADRLPVGLNYFKDNVVKISFSKPKVIKGSEVRLTVEAKPRSRVFLMSYLDGINMYGTYNTYLPILWPLMVMPGQGYSGRFTFHGSWFYTGEIDPDPFRLHDGGTHQGPVPVDDSFVIFSSLQAGLITDGQLPGRRNASLLFGQQRPANATVSRSKREATPAPGTTGTPVTANDTQQSKAFFSDTWLWQIVKIGKSGKKVLRLKAPDKIDRWTAFAMAVHPKLGLSWPERTAELETTDGSE